MRIALVTPGSTTPAVHEPGGQAARARALAQALAAQGHRVTIYTRREAHERPCSTILAPGVRLEYAPAAPAAGPPKLGRRIPKFAEYLEGRWAVRRPDVIHAHDWAGGLAALPGARHLGIPVVQSFSSLAATERRLRLPGCGTGARARVEAALARSASTVLVKSGAEASELTRLGVPRRRSSIVPCGVDTGRFRPDGRAASRNGRKRLLATGPLTGQEGLDVVVRALAAVPGAELVIIGSRPAPGPRTQEEHYDLLRLASAVGVQDRVSFTGPVPDADVPALLRSADLLVSMARHEPSAVATITAAACGVPAAASDVGSNQDVVIDGITGVLVPPGRPDLLARRLRRLLAAPSRLEAFGIAAADRARARYAWARIGREAAAAYARCLPPPAEAAGHALADAAGTGKDALPDGLAEDGPVVS